MADLNFRTLDLNLLRVFNEVMTERSLTRKFKEMILAVRLERALPKRRIFELYLNSIEWGDGVFGADAAAAIIAWAAAILVSYAGVGVAATAQAVIFRRLTGWRPGQPPTTT